MSTNTAISKLNKSRLSQAEKNANDGKWYREYADRLDTHTIGSGFADFSGYSNHWNKQPNYDLFNGIINKRDFEYVTKPFGEKGNLPANFENRDIVSSKIKVLLGMEMSMPFSWKIIATNEQATTRKEQEETSRVKNFVVNEIMRPIKLQIEKQAQEQSKGQKLTPEEQQKIQEQIAEETQAQTPDEVRKYMTREHQDPAERMHSQLLRYLVQKEKVEIKFNKGFKHLNLGAREVYHIKGDELTVVNVLNFTGDESPELDFIEDGEFAVCRYRMTPSQILSKFSDKLTEEEIDRIYSHEASMSGVISSADFIFTSDNYTNNNAFTIEVVHTDWKAPQKIGFLIYKDRKGKEQLSLVDENYQLNEAQGDIDLQWEWIPEEHECWKIFNDIYVDYGAVPGQNRDIDNLYNCKLSYYGAVCDNLNSVPTSPMDRIKNYQYFYDIIMYRVELLMASDKGKILAANINLIPKSAGIDTAKFMYFMEANKIAWFNTKEEGNRQGADITNVVKEIDMSLASDIQKYIAFAEYIERRAGGSIGVTPQMEAQIAAGEAVTNTQQNLQQASHIIRPFFELHNNVKGNVLKGLLERAKVKYSNSNTRKLSYVADDMSVHMLTLDQGLLDSTTLGLFVGNSSNAESAKQAIVNLGQAAMQNQQIDMGDMVKILKSNDMNEAAEELDVSQQKKQEQAQAMDKQKMQQEQQAQLRQDTLLRDTWKHEEDMVVLKEKERRETELQKQAMMSLGFDPNKDEDNDGEPDVLEVYKHGLNVEIKRKELVQGDQQLQLEQAKLDHKIKDDSVKNKLTEKQINKPTGSK